MEWACNTGLACATTTAPEGEIVQQAVYARLGRLRNSHVPLAVVHCGACPSAPLPLPLLRLALQPSANNAHLQGCPLARSDGLFHTEPPSGMPSCSVLRGTSRTQNMLSSGLYILGISSYNWIAAV